MAEVNVEELAKQLKAEVDVTIKKAEHPDDRRVRLQEKQNEAKH